MYRIIDKNLVYERRILISTWINPICKAWWFFWKKLRHFRSCKSLKDRPDEFLEAFQETSSHFLTTIVPYSSPVIPNEQLKCVKEYQRLYQIPRLLKINLCIHIYWKYSRFINESGVTRGPPRLLREIPHENKILEPGNFKLMNQPIISYDSQLYTYCHEHVVWIYTIGCQK